MSRLALVGGEPLVRPGTDLKGAWPPVHDDDIAAVVRMLERGEFWGRRSPEIQAFEEEYAQTIGVRYCVAMGSGTAALHAAVEAAGVLPGDEVIVPALSFLASATAILHQLGIPIFVDIDPVTFNLDPARIEERITERTRAIMAVHLHGLPCDMDAINAIARRRGLVVIEDAAQAQIAQYHGRKVGSLGDMAGISIMPVKNLATCGEGGMFVTNELAYRNKADMLKMFGESLEEGEGQHRQYNALTLGYNYRFNPVQAAFARTQLKRLPHYTEVIVAHAEHLTSVLGEIPGVIPPIVPPGRTHVYHHYRVTFDPAAAGVDLSAGVFRQAVMDAMAAEGTPLRLYQTTPLPGQEVFQRREGFGHGIPWSLPQADPQATARGYAVEDFPSTLRVLEGTAIVGQGSGSHTFYYRDRVDLYRTAFLKVFENLDAVVQHAKSLVADYQPPWHGPARLS